MVLLKEVVDFFDRTLKVKEFCEGSYNGLQFEGRPEVKKVFFAVDAGIETFKRAAEAKADLIVVHHGLFWKEANPSYCGYMKERLDILYKNQISLYAVHLPLDSHKELGNNAQLIKMLGGKIGKGFLDHNGKNIAWVGELAKERSFSDIEKILNKGLNTKCITLPFGKKKIRTIAVCSGGPKYSAFFEILGLGVDAYLTGEPIDIYHAAKDAKFNVIFAGHHTTETTGIIALEKLVRKNFKVETIFVDIPTGL